MDQSVERQLGEIAATQKYTLGRVEGIDNKLTALQAQVDALNLEIAAAKGGRKATGAIGSLIGGIIGAITSLLGAWALFGGPK